MLLDSVACGSHFHWTALILPDPRNITLLYLKLFWLAMFPQPEINLPCTAHIARSLDSTMRFCSLQRQLFLWQLKVYTLTLIWTFLNGHLSSTILLATNNLKCHKPHETGHFINDWLELTNGDTKLHLVFVKVSPNLIHAARCGSPFLSSFCLSMQFDLHELKNFKKKNLFASVLENTGVILSPLYNGHLSTARTFLRWGDVRL